MNMLRSCRLIKSIRMVDLNGQYLTIFRIQEWQMPIYNLLQITTMKSLFGPLQIDKKLATFASSTWIGLILRYFLT